jgi:hypothetical protein
MLHGLLDALGFQIMYYTDVRVPFVSRFSAPHTVDTDVFWHYMDGLREIING